METPRSEAFDPEEMSRFGFDPDSEADRQAWVQTTPPGGYESLPADYGDDPFEFGSSAERPGQQG